MRRVKSKDTSPELYVRELLRRLGHRGYRLHRADIPGKPDIVWIGRRRAIFINGCFWHGHSCARGARVPQTRAEYWLSKIARTRQRDERNTETLAALGWTVLTLWECELRDEAALAAKLQNFLG
ncbi:DNA mismatch endonuclease Vsr [Duganella sp. FT50W]|uniref:DNA mismatch endonuclease Vsr n=1 Tax=Duganella lactea TaxID=2692173 RepID=A0A6L8MKA3_9BURK|nr:very short patch repair endonuclease [Duganella lactea]MYM83049.1 DNA mismatch endonuclease Vsr [Duganella lactea]